MCIQQERREHNESNSPSKLNQLFLYCLDMKSLFRLF